MLLHKVVIKYIGTYSYPANQVTFRINLISCALSIPESYDHAMDLVEVKTKLKIQSCISLKAQNLVQLSLYESYTSL